MKTSEAGRTISVWQQKHPQSRTVELKCAEREGNTASSNRVAAENGDRSCPQWVSNLKRLFDSRGDNKEFGVGSIASSRLLRFLVVGGTGVGVNLFAMALLIQGGYSSAWWASASASIVAAVHNYLLNNYWTFRDRRRNGRALLGGVFLYLSMSAVGIAVTAASYSFLAQARFRTNLGASSLYLLGAQLISIVFGTYLNYTLNKSFTWRVGRDQL
jgi:putative flippase GtrA